MPSTDVAYNNPNDDNIFGRHKFIYILTLIYTLKTVKLYL